MELAIEGGEPTTKKYARLFWAAAVILIFNLLDGMITLAVVNLGIAEEANPLMAMPLSWGAVAFMIVKLGLVSLGVMLLWRLRNRRYARTALVSLAAVYSVIFVYHFRSMSMLAEMI